ncbi:sensor histidine kinase [Nocardia sp. NPDC060256]|uniref:sensor histidine kinase n=1 Tax=unclassified Nocardia TaxID=2637762 RepID=UPI00365CE51F
MPLLALLTCAAITSVVVVIAVYYAPTDFRIPLTAGAVTAAIALCATATAAVHYRGAARRARESAAAITAEATARMAAASEAAGVHAWEAKSSDSRRSAAMAAFAGAAGRMQAMTTSMLAELREMEHRHADPKVLADLLHLDHRTAQAGRLADSIAVLSGARSGRRWAKPIAMESILRGAMGRVAGYQRVRLRAIAEIAIAGHAAEGVMHTLAELLDNACNFSPPTTEVHVYAAEVPAGVVLTIEDSGLVMSESALRRAEQTVSNAPQDGRGQRSSDLSSLSGTRLGLAVVGHLARKHGLTVSYRPSAIGGTAVVVVVPRDLTARVDRSQPASLATNPAIPTSTLPSATSPVALAARPVAPTLQPVALTPQPAAPTTLAAAPTTLAAEQAPPEPEALPEPATEHTSMGLPKRRRGSTLAAVHPAGLSLPSLDAPAATPPASTPAAFGAFQRALAGRDTDNSAAATPSPSPTVAVENDR